MAIIVEKLSTVVPDGGTMVPHYMMVMDEDTLVLVAALIGTCCTKREAFGGDIEYLYGAAYEVCSDKIEFADDVFNGHFGAVGLIKIQEALDEEFNP